MARINADADRAARDIRNQVRKEVAGMNAIIGCGDAVEQLPSDLPDSHRRMAERVAINASRMIRRLSQ
ncbi:hypothetical protein ACNQR7_30070 [Mycolicibacterium senegalense]|uniref:hypothetical protein n=1 Tax=Mycolicibacterium senegalense TaxID=1796 RepID=UPI003AB038B5